MFSSSSCHDASIVSFQKVSGTESTITFTSADPGDTDSCNIYIDVRYEGVDYVAYDPNSGTHAISVTIESACNGPTNYLPYTNDAKVMMYIIGESAIVEPLTFNFDESSSCTFQEYYSIQPAIIPAFLTVDESSKTATFFTSDPAFDATIEVIQVTGILRTIPETRSERTLQYTIVILIVADDCLTGGTFERSPDGADS